MAAAPSIQTFSREMRPLRNSKTGRTRTWMRRRWTTQQYQQWLAGSIARLLFATHP
jgi:hypothetical protein